MSNKVIKPVAFNAVKDKDMINHLKRRNFSGYVKKLIAADMKTKATSKDMSQSGGIVIKL